MSLPFRLTPNLMLSIGADAVRLTPDQALQAAAQLIRKGTRQMMLEEALSAMPEPRRPVAPERRRRH